MQQIKLQYEATKVIKVDDHNMVPAGLYQLNLVDDDSTFAHEESNVVGFNCFDSFASPKDPFGLESLYSYWSNSNKSMILFHA